MYITSMVITDTTLQIIVEDIIDENYNLVLTLIDECGAIEVKELVNENIYNFEKLEPNTVYYCIAKYNDEYIRSTGFITYPFDFEIINLPLNKDEGKNPKSGVGILGPTPPNPF